MMQAARRLTPTGYFADVLPTSLYVVASDSPSPPENQSPTEIYLTRNTVTVDAGTNSLVGAFSAADADDTEHTFTLVAGTGDTDNASFSISGVALLCDDPNALGIGTYSIRVEADDGSSTPYSTALTIQVVAAQTNDGPRGAIRSATRSPSRNPYREPTL